MRFKRRLVSRLIFRAAILVMFAVPLPVAAQLYVRVSSHGVGVSGAEVLAWAETQLLGRAVTDFEGRARVVLAPLSGQSAKFLTVRRLGFGPNRVSLSSTTGARGDSLFVELEQVPMALAVLVVRESRLRCPRVSEARAERLWRSAAAHYTPGQAQLYFGYDEILSEDELVTPDARGFGESMSRHRRLIVPPDNIHRLLLASSPPYAAYERHANVFGEYWRWRYAPLHRFAAGHFATDDFRERHVLAILDSADGNTTVGFCPRGRNETAIKGELVIGPDTLFRSGKWSYQVSHDSGDDAGAEAVFGTSTFEGRMFLVAVQGAMWRREGRELFRQDRYALSAWRFGHTSLDATPEPSSLVKAQPPQ
jgi:hypothetical protein